MVRFFIENCEFYQEKYFLGLYCVKTRGKHIRIVVMNNLLPRDVKMSWKYDLKGSTLKRTASEKERNKKSPTFKDLDFRKVSQKFTSDKPSVDPCSF